MEEEARSNVSTDIATYVLIVGAGTMGRKHIASYKKIKHVKIAGVVDISKSKLSEVEKLGISIFTSIEEAVEQLPQIDVVDICLPTHLHKEYVEIAAQFGKHIICEKPLARNLEEASDIMAVCEKYKVRLYVGHVVRFFPFYKQAKKWIDSGKLGDISCTRMFRNSLYPTWSNWYKNHEKSGGLILDLLIHDIDFLLWCYGDVEFVHARRLPTTSTNEKAEPIEKVEMTLYFTNGLTAKVSGGWSQEPFHTHFTIRGSKGELKADSRKKQMQLLSFDDHREVAFTQDQDNDPYMDELAHFIECIRRNRDSKLITPKEASQSVALCLKALESLQANEKIQVM